MTPDQLIGYCTAVLIIFIIGWSISVPSEPNLKSVNKQAPRLHDEDRKVPPLLDWLALGAAVSWAAIVLGMR